MVALAGEVRVRGDLDRDHQVAVGSAAAAGVALPGEADGRAVADAGGDLDGQPLGLALPLDGQFVLASGGGDGEGDRGGGAEVLPLGDRLPPPPAAAEAAAEQVAQVDAALPEQVVDVDLPGAEGVAAVELLVVGPELVVLLAVLLVAEDLVGLRGGLEAFGGRRVVGVAVRVALLGDPLVGLADVVLGGGAGDAKRLVVVAGGHRAKGPPVGVCETADRRTPTPPRKPPRIGLGGSRESA